MRLAETALTSRHCADDPVCHRRAVLTLIYSGELSTAEEYCLTWPDDQAFALVLGRINYLTGDCAAAAEIISSALTASLPAEARATAVAWLVEALVQLDDLNRAESVLAANAMFSGAAAPAVVAARAALHLAAGRFHQAVNDYLACGGYMTAARITNPAVVPWRSRAALSALAMSRVDLATALADEELVAARRWGSPAAIGTALHPVALLQDDDRAVQMLTDAATLLHVANARDEEIWALHDLGLVLARHNQTRAARTQLEHARDFAGHYGYTRWSRRIQSALDKVTSPARWRALTKQEARIAELAAAGYTNNQIAAQLFLTVRTIEFHLSGVYCKLDISGRRELSYITPKP